MVKLAYSGVWSVGMPVYSAL